MNENLTPQQIAIVQQVKMQEKSKLLVQYLDSLEDRRDDIRLSLKLCCKYEEIDKKWNKRISRWGSHEPRQN